MIIIISSDFKLEKFTKNIIIRGDNWKKINSYNF